MCCYMCVNSAAAEKENAFWKVPCVSQAMSFND